MHFCSIVNRIKLKHAHGTSEVESASVRARRENLARKLERFEEESEVFLKPVAQEEDDSDASSEINDTSQSLHFVYALYISILGHRHSKRDSGTCIHRKLKDSCGSAN